MAQIISPTKVRTSYPIDANNANDIILPSDLKEEKNDSTKTKSGTIENHIYQNNIYVTAIIKTLTDPTYSTHGSKYSLYDYLLLSLKYSISDYNCKSGREAISSLIYASRVLLGGGPSDFKVFSSKTAIVVTRGADDGEYSYIVLLPMKDKSKVKYIKYLSNERGFMESLVSYYTLTR